MKGILTPPTGTARSEILEQMDARQGITELVLDPSSIYTNSAIKLISEMGTIKKITIPLRTVQEFEDRAKHGDDLGLKGLKSICDYSVQNNVDLSFVPSPQEVRDAREAARDLAFRNHAVLVTADPLTARSSSAMGIDVIRITPEKRLSLRDFFERGVMSVHLKEGVTPRIKRGVPGKWTFEEFGKRPISRDELESLVLEIMASVQSSPDSSSFVEIDKPGSTIIQLGDCRIVIARPPFSDGLEITAARPIVRKSMPDYRLPEDVHSRVESRAEGILIAGSPGMGKSTFAQALAEFYRSKGKVVKTVESPRDMQLPPDITQYSKTAATPAEIHDVLLLSRPDYTIFDELRSDSDFDLFIDLRLAGIGMVGVVHATSAIDAVQRFVHRVDLGLVPSIVDTIVFLQGGEVVSVHVLETAVKIPTGLTRSDLARPTVVMRNIITGRAEYELYVFGEKTFVVPIRKRQDVRDERISAAIQEVIGEKVRDYVVDIEEGKIRVRVPPQYIREFSRRIQKNLIKVGRRFRMALEIEPLRQRNEELT